MDNNNTVQGTQFCDIFFNFFMSKSIDNMFATFSVHIDFIVVLL